MKKLFIYSAILMWFVSAAAEEGMYPLTELPKLNLKKTGFEISAQDIFNEQGVSLSDAIVNIGGCTGSFVSPDGLILTNHHCAFGAVQSASTPEHDYLQDGFSAISRDQELEAKGYTVRITESYRDVSKEVLAAVQDNMDYQQRFKAMERVQKEIIKKAEQENKGKRAGIAEMFRGEKYILFIYTYIKDVRMVYVPPRSLGEFGGEIDNWEWPRHTADFSFMRAYVAPDGSPADFSPDNVPYQPKSYLKVNPDGVEEEDLVFILGYPGRTYRHRTASYMDYQETIRMPFVVDWYQWQINYLEELGGQDHELALKLSTRIKWLANTEKNYRGKLKGMKRINLVDKKREQEADMLKFIASQPDLKEKFGDVLSEIDHLYREIGQSARRNMILSYLSRHVTALSLARTIVTAAEERQKDDLDRESAYMDRNFDRTKKYTRLNLKNYYAPADKTILKELLQKAQALAADQKIKAVGEIFTGSDLDEIIDAAYQKTLVTSVERLDELFEMNPDQIKELDDPVIDWYLKLKPEYDALKEINESRAGKLDALYARWSEVKKLYLKTEFIPDANGTFRLTYGHIRGYTPRDAVYMAPITSLSGVIEKTTGEEPFDTPQKVINLYNQRNFGRFLNKKLNDVPVAILYDMDTTGGNSGSPVMNARGELIGLNFDRTFDATINDYAWSESYSRSIGVDIRYILWVTQKVGGMDQLLDEMGI